LERMRASREARGKRGRQSQEGGVEGPATHYDCKSGLSTGAHKCLVKNSKSVIGISSFGERRGGRRTQATDDVVPGRTRRHLGLTGRALCLRGTSPSEWGSKEAASLPRLWRLYTIVGCWVAAKMRNRTKAPNVDKNVFRKFRKIVEKDFAPPRATLAHATRYF